MRMDLFSNPFHLLGLTNRSGRGEIAEAAEAAVLSADPDAAAEAALTLANPRKRLTAEVFYLPGMSRGEVDSVLAGFDGPPAKVERRPGVSAAAGVNLAAAALSRLGYAGRQGIADGVTVLSEAFERITAEDLAGIINLDRNEAGVPPVRSLPDVEEELERLRLHCRETVRNAMDRMLSKDLVAAAEIIVSAATGGGKRPAPVVVRDLMEIYELAAGEFFEREAAVLRKLQDALKATATAAASGDVRVRRAMAVAEDLGSVMKNWGTVARPLLVLGAGTGIRHRKTVGVIADARNAVVEYCNKAGDPAVGRKITPILRSVFGSVPEIREATEKDARALGMNR
jgi:hypothetical protein